MQLSSTVPRRRPTATSLHSSIASQRCPSTATVTTRTPRYLHSSTHALHTHSSLQRPGFFPRPSSPGLRPHAFAPTPAGSKHSATQQLAAIFHAFHRQGGKVTYATIEELHEALDDWATEFVKAGRSAQQVECVRAYQHLLIQQFAISDCMPLKQVLEYHRLWCKAVANGTIDMFASHSALDLHILRTVTHPPRLSRPGSTSSSTSPRDSKLKAASQPQGQEAERPSTRQALAPTTRCPPRTPLHVLYTTTECLMKK